ncbi:hypothetical protein [Duganella radicis]|uniref:Uncharacterized protein n=1 Tax=Duganella radicis TaxID=551988 RepID=A0A6L6PML1_9BURK|nr:hypothetical protein [Duganella radicis]MTV39877.1 hypothetical protein [Duganella radicis]
MDELIEFRKSVEAIGGRTADADGIVHEIANALDVSLLPPLFSQLEVESNRLGWSRDCDYAAVALQAASLSVASPVIRKAMLDFALARAEWCASCATAGGEGIARSVHVQALRDLLKNGV